MRRVSLAILVIAAMAAGTWWYLQRNRAVLPPGFAAGNGRIEANEIDIATKYAARILEIRVDEGDLVRAGQIVALLDTRDLAAQLRSAEAQVVQAQQQRNQVLAEIRQRQSELSLADKELQRTLVLSGKNFVSEQKVDQQRNIRRTAEAVLAAAESRRGSADAAIQVAQAEAERIRDLLQDGTLTAPKAGRILFRLAETGEVLGAGGKVATLLDLSDVYMTFFLPASAAGRVALGAEARLLLDAAPARAVPAQVSFVSAQAQFTPKQVETRSERERMMFRVKARVPPALVQQHLEQVKTGLTGMAYVRLDPQAVWPDWLESDLIRQPAQ
ncbi:MAG: HlyD family efflux transporter periplasmic adaptor subunit [Ferrovibrio sp.]|uniref:HlyD family secretion protein n=1 Tax=Ferrovibrio sp. TaxID=1917215 RepID=UPI002638B99F|nr:HlyD family efflux transporter periplasmic adaptor subunit [Ferrovibrio sp.]MCW0233104.1 HlyD family efflux transporter periplasmic adaptor subunit [Ferrovibrio sp.]